MIALSGPVARVLCLAITVYWVIVFARIIMSWVPPPMTGAFRVFYEVIHELTDPVMRPLQKVVPPVRAGAMGLDLSPILLFVILAVLRSAIGC